MQFGPCFHCGKSVDVSSPLCSNCGADLIGRRPPKFKDPNPMPALPPDEKPRRRKPPAGLPIAVVWILAIVFAAFFSIVVFKDNLFPSHRDLSKIHFGMTEAEVREMMGDPSSTQKMSTAGLTMDCWYYGPTNQVCFDNGRVNSISRY